MFIIKVTVKEITFVWDLQRDELLDNVESLENLYFKLDVIITSAKKRDKVSIAITSSTLILFSLYSKVLSKHFPRSYLEYGS